MGRMPLSRMTEVLERFSAKLTATETFFNSLLVYAMAVCEQGRGQRSTSQQKSAAT